VVVAVVTGVVVAEVKSTVYIGVLVEVTTPEGLTVTVPTEVPPTDMV
jgi:hypothetical protein